MTIKELNLAVEGYVVEGGTHDSRVVLGFDAGRVMWMKWSDGFVGSSTLVRETVTEVAVEEDTLCWFDGERWRLAYSGRFRRDDQAHE